MMRGCLCGGLQSEKDSGEPSAGLGLGESAVDVQPVERGTVLLLAGCGQQLCTSLQGLWTFHWVAHLCMAGPPYIYPLPLPVSLLCPLHPGMSLGYGPCSATCISRHTTPAGADHQGIKRDFSLRVLQLLKWSGVWVSVARPRLRLCRTSYFRSQGQHCV
jgi:hypothetical protein